MTREEYVAASKLEREIQSAKQQIDSTCSRIHDSQEHAQIVRLEARLELEQKRLADLLKGAS